MAEILHPDGTPVCVGDRFEYEYQSPRMGVASAHVVARVTWVGRVDGLDQVALAFETPRPFDSMTGKVVDGRWTTVRSLGARLSTAEGRSS